MPVWLIVVILLALLVLGGTGLFVKGLVFLFYVALALLAIYVIVMIAQRVSGRSRL